MAQKFERLVQEDLNIGTGPTWITAPGRGELRSTQVGLHSVARGQKAYTSSWTPTMTAHGYSNHTPITVPDATPGDFVMASHDKMGTSGLMIYGHVSAADTVNVVLYNPTTASVTLAAGTVSVLVFPAKSSASPSDPGPAFSVTWVVVESEAGVVGESWDYSFTPTVVGGIAPYTYSWDFDDGEAPDTSDTPTQVWARASWTNPDDITVTLTVTDDTSATAIYADTVTVQFNE